MTMRGWAHELSCAGPSDCSCTPILVRESPTSDQPIRYDPISRVELQSDRLRREASPVLNPLVAPRSVIEVEQ